MRLVLDGIPLAEKMTGVGHYTFELARALANSHPEAVVDVVSPFPFSEELSPERPHNLRLSTVQTNLVTRRWWISGLARYLARSGAQIFHGTNFELPILCKVPRVVTVHDLSAVL